MDMPKAKRSLKAFKGHVTRAINNTETLLKQKDVDVVELQSTIKSLTARWEQYEKASTTVESLLLESDESEEGIEQLQKDYYVLQASYQQSATNVRLLINKSYSTGGQGTFNQTTATATSAKPPQLPTIQLPTFSGELTEYEAFIDQFEAQVGSRSDLESVTKLQYLKTQLKGRAFDLVKGYSSIAANYQSALETLKETYGNEEKIKHCLLQNIVNLEQPKHTRTDLEKFRVSMLNLTRSLTNRHDYSCCEWIIASLFQHKLHTSTIRHLYLKYNKNFFDLTELNEGIRDLVSHMEIETQHRTNKPTHAEGHGQSLDHQKTNQIGTYCTTSEQGKKIKSVSDDKCIFCGLGHKSSYCSKYRSGHERIQRLKEIKLCSRCMGKHHARICNTPLQGCRRCQRGIHHSTLCKSYDKPYNVDPSVATQPSGQKSHQGSAEAANVNHLNVSTTSQHPGVALAIAEASIEEYGIGVNLFFDQGAQKTFITRNIVERSGMPIKSTRKLTVKGFMSEKRTQDFQIVKPVIKMGNRRKRITALVVDELPETIVTVGLTDVTRVLTRQGVNLATPIVRNDEVGPVDVLIGADYYFDFISHHTVKMGVNLLQSPSGFIVSGKIPNSYCSAASSNREQVIIPESLIVMKITNHVNPLVEETQLENDQGSIHKLWDLDAIGINPTQPSPDDKASYEEYLDTVRYDCGQYWVKLPWKVDKPELPNNYKRSLGQMHSTAKELTKRNQIDTYHEVISGQLKSKFIEEVPNAQPSDRTHYLPHHAVYKESSTTPLRIVYNCSAKENPQAHSLNDCLMTGPTLTKKLGDVLLSYRINKFAYTADISKAFLRIGLEEDDRDYTRFLWLSDPKNLDSAVKTYRFRSVLFGATSSPFLLQATIDYHLRNSSSPIKELLARNFYVDNFQGTTDDEYSLLTLYKEANKELQLANMPLRQWTTNNAALQKQIQQDFPEYNIPGKTNVLGIQWNLEEDTIAVKAVKAATQDSLTKRRLLAQVSKLFDPLGFFSPVSIKGKILLQEAWKLKVGWDDPLPDTYSEHWQCIADEYSDLHTIHLPRSVVNDLESCSLHIFCDASSKAYGAVAYVVTNRSLLLTSKARVAPLKGRTIPQLELTALAIGCKLGSYIHQTLRQLHIKETVIWSDNEVALQWIRNDNSNLPYVKNRVVEIREYGKDFLFWHVETKCNPADLLSRGATMKQLTKNSLWFHGPEWLTNKQRWPEQKSCIVSSITSDCLKDNVEDRKKPSKLIDEDKYSSLRKLLRITDYVFQFIKCIMVRKGWNDKISIMNSTTYWIQRVQSEIYYSELTVLKDKSKTLPSELSKRTLGVKNNEASSGGLSTKTPTVGSDSFSGLSTKTPGCGLVNQLGLFLDEDMVIRCRGRLHNSSLSYGSKHPILLPKNHWFTHLVIMDAHQNTLHGGISDTLIHLRKSFWIPKARQVIKSTIRKCVICQRYDARPLQYPGPPPLPRERLQQARPFQVVGVDYSGPLQITNPGNEDGIQSMKVYICLFTCATTRAVHLELATDMSANTFLRAFRRFAGRRSCPELVISDNGSNFRASASFLKGYFCQDEVREFFKTRRCEWKFIPPGAPWQGGFYERMIGVVKKCLRKILHNKRITVDELRTLLTEIEARINNRPLTYVHNSLDEPEALTPNHLLQGVLIDTIPPIINMEYKVDPDFNMKLPSNKELTSRFQHINRVLKQWNRIWYQDYLTSLREQHYGGRTASAECMLKPGDVVIIDCDVPRTSWPLGRVESLLPDKNGTVRVVKVLSKGNLTLRTIEKLIPLEASSEMALDTKGNTPPIERRRRQAALRARVQWQASDDANTEVED